MLTTPVPAPATPPYLPRHAGTNELYAALHAQVETLVARAEEADRPVPAHVERALRGYLACGIPAHGFTWLRCAECEHSVVVPLNETASR